MTTRSLLALTLGCCHAASAEEVPDVLRRALTFNDAMRTSRIEYAVNNNRGVRFYTVQTAPNGAAITDHGGPDGVVGIDEYPETGQRVESKAAVSELIADGDAYKAFDHRLSVNYGDPSIMSLPYPQTIAAMSMGQVAGRGKIEDALRAHADAGSTFTVATDIAGVLVAMTTPRGDRVEWLIDPQRNYVITGTRAVNPDGSIRSEARIVIDQSDGLFYPSSIVYGGEFGYTVTKAEFNRPEHPQRLTPEAIGVDAGHHMVGSHGRPSGYYAGAGRVLPLREYMAELRSGAITVGPNASRKHDEARAWNNDPKNAAFVARKAREAHAALPLHARSFARWKSYTATFVADHKFSADQKADAQEVLDRALREGREYIERAKDKIAEHQSEAVAAASMDGPEGEKRQAKSNEQRAMLMEPLDRIFEDVLKRGLDRLLTDEQRRAGGKESP